MNDIMKPHFRKEYGEAEVKKLEKRFDRLEEIKSTITTIKNSAMSVSDLKDSEYVEDTEYILKRLDRYEKALKEITEIDLTWDEPLPTAMRRLAHEALRKDE